MTLTRRAFLRTVGPRVGVPAAAMITARGREALEGELGVVEAGTIPPVDIDEIRISSNENPLGPGPAAIQAIRDNIDQENRYPMNSRITDKDVRKRLAKKYGATMENIVVAPDQTVWCSTLDMVWPYPGGLTHFVGRRSKTFTASSSPLPHNQIEALTIRPVRGSYELWVGTASEGVAVVRP